MTRIRTAAGRRPRPPPPRSSSAAHPPPRPPPATSPRQVLPPAARSSVIDLVNDFLICSDANDAALDQTVPVRVRLRRHVRRRPGLERLRKEIDDRAGRVRACERPPPSRRRCMDRGPPRRSPGFPARGGSRPVSAPARARRGRPADQALDLGPAARGRTGIRTARRWRPCPPSGLASKSAVGWVRPGEPGRWKGLEQRLAERSAAGQAVVAAQAAQDPDQEQPDGSGEVEGLPQGGDPGSRRLR